MGTRNLKLTLAYDGTRFVGWQRQVSGESIQGLLEAALARFEGGGGFVGPCELLVGSGAK